MTSFLETYTQTSIKRLASIKRCPNNVAMLDVFDEMFSGTFQGHETSPESFEGKKAFNLARQSYLI